MRVFVTGASGWIGSAVVPELLGAGHQVIGLARSDESAAALARAGVEVQRGSLDDVESLRAGAAAADAVVHLAFKHDLAFTGGYAEAAAADRQAIGIFGSVLEATGGALVIASGTAALPPGKIGTEMDVPDGAHPLHIRFASEELAMSLAPQGVRSISMRFSPTVHGDGDNGFMAMLIALAREKQLSAYVGDGSNRWPAVHRLDAARLVRLAVESAPAGSRLHAVADEGVPFRDIAEVFGRQLDVPVVSLSADQVADHFGFLGMLVGADIPASSELTRTLLDWTPTHPGLIEDLEQGHYLDA